MMASNDSRVRQMFDAVEEPLRKKAEALTATEEFSRALFTALGAWSTVTRSARAVSSGVLHMANVPAYGDVRRLSRQVGALEAKIDKLASELERLASRLDEPPTAKRGREKGV